MHKNRAYSRKTNRNHQRVHLRRACKLYRPLDANGSVLKDGLRSYEFDAAGRLAAGTTGAGIDAPTTRYVHNALGQRLFKTEPLYAPVASGSNPTDPGVIATLLNFFTKVEGQRSRVRSKVEGQVKGRGSGLPTCKTQS